MADYILKGQLVLDSTAALKDVKQLPTQIEKSTKETQNLNRAFGGTVGILGRALAIGAAFSAIQFVQESIKQVTVLGAELDRVDQGMRELSASSGLNLRQVSLAVKEASDGTITWAESIRQVNQSLLLGGGTDILENLDDLFKIARGNARAMGIDVERALESMVTGLGRVSPRWLDNLGIIIDTRGEYRKLADELGKTSSELTDQEQRVALINGILEKYGYAIADAETSNISAAESFEVLKSGVADYAAEIGIATTASERFVKGLAAIGNYLADKAAIKSSLREWKAYADVNDELYDSWKKLGVLMSQGAVETTTDQYRHLETLLANMRYAVEHEQPYLAAGMAREIMNYIETQQAGLTEGIEIPLELIPAIDEPSADLTDSRQRAEDASESIKKLVESYQTLGAKAVLAGVDVSVATAAVAKATEAANLLSDNDQFIDAGAMEQLVTTGEITKELEFALGVLDGTNVKINFDSNARDFLEDVDDILVRFAKKGVGVDVLKEASTETKQWADVLGLVDDGWLRINDSELHSAASLGQLEDTLDGVVSATDDAAKSAKEAQAAYDDWYDSLASDVESALLSGLDVKPEDFLEGYEDAPLEAVRRLDDIAKLGLESPWVKMFEIPQDVLDKGPDAVKRWAAEMARSGRNLENIELIDKDAFLRELEEMQVAAENKKNTIATAIQWAIDAGLAANRGEAENLVGQYLGEEGATTSGNIKSSFEEGMKKYNMASYVSSTWAGQLEGQEAAFNSLGASIAEYVVAGFTDRIGDIDLSGLFPTPGGVPVPYDETVGDLE